MASPYHRILLLIIFILNIYFEYISYLLLLFNILNKNN